MLKRTVATLVSLALSIIPMTAGAGSNTKAKTWNPAVKSGKVKAQRYTAPNGSKVLVAPDGNRYLLDDSGKHYMVDGNGNKVQVNQAGKIIEVGGQKMLKKRLGPGPLA
ncbi:MAG: hypothetical protein K9L59_07220 [Desulfobacterales bacterium]|nr:hypothetical protein [Desulfobacterales bacterium]MCF8079782.1 hypothetical protein [Desulfobacterales bacterium]